MLAIAGVAAKLTQIEGVDFSNEPLGPHGMRLNAARKRKGGSEKPSFDRVGPDGFSMKGNPIPIFVKVATARHIRGNLKRTHDAAGS